MNTIDIGGTLLTQLLSFIDFLYLVVFMLMAEMLKNRATDWLSYLRYGNTKYMSGSRVSKQWVVAFIGVVVAIPFLLSPALQNFGTNPVVMTDTEVVQGEVIKTTYSVYGMKLFVTWAVACKSYDTLIASTRKLWSNLFGKSK